MSTPDLRLVNLILQAGEKVKSHTAPVEVVFLVLAGSGCIFVDGESVEVWEGQILRCPARTERSIEAAPHRDLSLLVIRAPNL